MAGSSSKTYGPAYISDSAADILGTTAIPANNYAIVTHIHVVNKDSAARTFNLYKGATNGSTGGTEIAGPAHSLAAAGSTSAYWDYYGRMKFISGTDYLSGLASSASKVTVTVEYELYAI